MKVRRFIALVAVAGLLAACSSSSPSAAAGDGNINATVHEWSIDLATSTIPAGEVTFNITNSGDETHEFVIVSTDLDAADLPVTDDKVDESAFTPVDEVEDIESGANPTLGPLTLEAGHYVILCNLTAHYGKGMHANLTVE